MLFNFSSKQQDLYDDILHFSRENLNVNLVERTQNQIFDRGLWEIAAQKNLTGLCIDKAYGGAGLTPFDTVLALEALGEGCEDGGLNFAISAHLFACLVPIEKYSSEALKLDYLPNLCNGTWIAANAMTESSSGSDVFDMASRARKDDNNYILDIEKTYVTNGPAADIYLTYAATNPKKGYMGGVSAFLIDRNIHDVEVSKNATKLGLRTCTMGNIILKDTKVDSSFLISGEGAGGQIFDYSMNFERICLGAIHLGTMRRMLKRVQAYLKTRKSNGLPIIKHQAIAHTLAEMHTQLQAARALTYNAAQNLNNGKKSTLDGAITKLFVSETFKKFSIELIQLFGGGGFRDDHEAGRILADSMGSTIYSGTSEIQKNIIASWIASEV